MQGGLLDGGSGDVDGLQHGVWVEAAGPADVHPYVEEPGDGLGRRELVGDRPPGLASDDAEVALEVEPVDLDDGAVAGVVEPFGALQPVPVEAGDLRRRSEEPVVGVDLEAEPFQECERVPVVVGHISLRVSEAVDEDVERPLGGHARVELPQRSGGRVAGVGVGIEALFLPALVELGELGLREKDLAARLESCRRAVSEHPEGDAADRPKVQGHILADEAVAPGGPADEETVLVGQGDGDSVVLELAHHVEGFDVEAFAGPAVPCEELIVVEGVRKAQHGRRVRDAGEAGGGLRADALCRGVGRGELRVAFLDLQKLAEERVELTVADLGPVEDVVEIVVPVYFFSEGFRPARCVRIGQVDGLSCMRV